MVFEPFILFSVLTIVVLAMAGGWTERLGALLFTAVILVTPILEPLTFNGYRWAVALSSLAVFAVLVWMALTRDRWWLILAAGCQLMALSTHLVAFLRVDSLHWTMVSLRWAAWLFLMGAALFGAWEARALSRLGHVGVSGEGPRATS